MDNVPCTYRISVKAVVKDEQGRILLARERSGDWELPGGGLDHGEEPRAGLEREIAEEIGCKVDWMSDQPVRFWTTFKDVGAGDLKWFGFVCYEAKISGELKPAVSGDGEAEELRYFTPEEARKLQLHVNTAPYFAAE
ncbi:MAG TPA: NUDIX hydrolase [Candidatus Saccharimonadales bacterium]|nr:NUDIX hydrolase [Candidatus Saccharimonadales bacterium]